MLAHAASRPSGLLPCPTHADLSSPCLTLVNARELEHEVSCLDLTTLGPQDAMEKDDNTGPAEDEEHWLLSVGLWTDKNALLMAVPSLRTLRTAALGGDTPPRSIVATRLADPRLLLLVGLGDGTLLSFNLKDGGGQQVCWPCTYRSIPTPTPPPPTPPPSVSPTPMHVLPPT